MILFKINNVYIIFKYLFFKKYYLLFYNFILTIFKNKKIISLLFQNKEINILT